MTNTEMASRMRRQARFMRVVNLPMRRLLALPFRTPLSARLMLLTITGRKTGRVYRQPVSYVRDAGGLLTPGGGKWTLNLREDEPIRIKLAGKDHHARPELIQDPTVISELLIKMIEHNRQIARFVPFADSHGNIDAARLATAIEHGFCIVRWQIGDLPSEPHTARRADTVT